MDDADHRSSRSCKIPCIPRSAVLDVARTLLRRGAAADYASQGRSAWLAVDWSRHRRRIQVGGTWVEIAELGPGDVTPNGPGDPGAGPGGRGAGPGGRGAGPDGRGAGPGGRGAGPSGRGAGPGGRGAGPAPVGGPPILLIHGLGASWPVWLGQLPAFAAAGHRVVALDLPGFGGSDMPADGAISVAGYAATAAGVIEALGIGRAHVVGHSLGGFVAAELALRRPELVDRLVLAAPAVLWQAYRRSGPLVALAGAAAVAERGAAGVLRVVARRPAGPPALGGAAAVPVPRRPRLRAAVLGASGVHVPQRIPPELQTELLRIARPTPGYLGALRALRGLDLRPELGTIAAPALIAWGDRDTLVGVEQLAVLQELLPGAETLVLERTGHRLMIERPDEFNAAVLAFLSA